MFSNKHASGITNAQRLKQRKALLLPWMANPLEEYFHEHGHEHGHSTDGSLDEKHPESHQEGVVKSHSEVAEEAEEIEEAGPIELFYDLFFVANLSTVTSVAAITDSKSLASYALFFIIMWFTWLQVTLYDIRFSVDSVYERVCKSLQFATMIGFATVSTVWDPFSSDADAKTVKALKTMTIVLLVSRVILGIQYGIVTWFATKVKKGVLPLIIHTVVMLIAAAAYLGLLFTFKEHSSSRSYVAWFAILPLEAVAVVTSSSLYRVLSFKKTHLVERMGLLTLIVMGEGIIVMLKAVNTVAKGAGWNSSIFGVIIASVAIIYIYWMYYFDSTPNNLHYGTIRQQIWALLHFPLHLAIVLSVEMLRQMTTFYSFFQQYNIVLDKVMAPINPILTGDAKALEALVGKPEKLGQLFNKTLSSLLDQLTKLYEAGTSKTVSRYYEEDYITIEGLQKFDWTKLNETTLNDYDQSFGVLVGDLITGMTEFYGIKEPKVKIKKEDDPEKIYQLEKPAKVLNLVFQTFFISVAVVMIMYAIMLLFVRRGKQGWDYAAAALRLVCGGIILALLSIDRTIGGKDATKFGFAQGPWPVPTVCLIVFLFLVVDKTMNFFAFRSTKAAVRNH